MYPRTMPRTIPRQCWPINQKDAPSEKFYVNGPCLKCREIGQLKNDLCEGCRPKKERAVTP